MYLNEGLLFVR